MIRESLDRQVDRDAALNPFPGLRPFEFHESHLFFGRDGQSERLVEKLSRTRLLAVVGASGSGKSSLVRAGLLPALLGGMLAGAGSVWRLALARPGNDPIGNLAIALCSPDAFGSEDEDNRKLQIAITEATLRRSSLGLIEAARQARQPAGANLLVIADQFEELFRVESGAKSEAHENHKAAFVKLLLAAAGQRDLPIYVLLTLRSDYLGDCARFPGLPEAINEGQFLVPRMNRAQLREAIAGPVAVREGQITPRLVNHLLNDVGDDQDLLPVLQHALMCVWDECREKRLMVEGRPHREVHAGDAIDLCCYKAVGNLTEALSRHADEAYEELPDAHHRHLAAKLFKCLSEKGRDNRGIRRPVTLAEICEAAEASEGEIKTVIETFRQSGRSFLMPPATTPLSASSLIDISHESLLRVWRRLSDWVSEEASSAHTYLRLAEAAAAHKDGKAGLYRDLTLQTTLQWYEENKPHRAWARRYAPDFESAEQFLAESKKVAEDERLRQKRQLKRARLVAGVLILLTLAVGAIACYALRQREVAQESQRQSDKLSYIAGVNLALKFFEEGDSAKSQRWLENFLPNPKRPQAPDLRDFFWGYVWLMNHHEQKSFGGDTGAVHSVAISPDGGTIASGGYENSIQLWEVAGEKKPAPLEGHTASVNQVAFSPDGRTLASGSDDRTVRLWDIVSKKELITMRGHTGDVTSVAFLPDGQILASGSADGTIRLWDWRDGRSLATLGGSDGPVRAVVFSPDGKMLASAGNGKTVRLWEVKSRRPLPILGRHGGIINSIAFSPDGRMLATGSEDHTIGLWDVMKRENLAPLLRHQDKVHAVALLRNPRVLNGLMLVSGGEDKTLKLWDVERRTELATFWGHKDSVRSVTASTDGQRLASGSEDGTVKLWEVRLDHERRTRKGHEREVRAVAFSLDGKTLASGGDDGLIKLWDVSGQRDPALLGKSAKAVNSVAFSPDGKLLATGSDGPLVTLWNIEHRQQARTLDGQVQSVTGVAFSPDGRLLAGGGEDGSVRWWEVGSGRPRVPLKGHQEPVKSVVFSPDNRMLASGGDDGLINLWDLASGQKLTTFHFGGPVYSIAFSHDGQTLVGGGQDNAPNDRRSLKGWNVVSGKQMPPFESQDGYIGAVAMLSFGQVVVSGGSNGTLTLWDIKLGKQIALLKLGEKADRPVTQNYSVKVAVSPNQKILASGDSGGYVTFWFAAENEQVWNQRGQ